MRLHPHLMPTIWAQIALAATLPINSVSSSSASVSTIFSLPGGVPSWIENLAYRPSTNTFLVTSLETAQVWSVDPSTSTGTLLGNATSSDGLVGITKLESSQDVFYIAGFNYTADNTPAPNSSVLWSLTYSSSSSSSSSSSTTTNYSFKKALDIPQMTLINGLTPWSPTTILAADSYQGAIYKIDVTTGAASIILQDPTMTTSSISAGVNGVKVFRPAADSDGQTTYVYYTCTDQGLLVRVPVDPVTAAPLATAAVEIIASGLGAPDDFALLEDGSVMLTTGAGNTVVHVSLDGTVTTIAGSEDSLVLASSTACQFGRDGVLYVTTAGGSEGAVNGTYGHGSVVAIDLRKWI